MLDRRSGVILKITVHLLAGYAGVTRKSHYVTAKAALRALTKVVALDVSDYRHSLPPSSYPAAMDADLWQKLGPPDGRRAGGGVRGPP